MGLTRKRDLRDGSAVWKAYPAPKFGVARLRRSVRTEVVIVGAGISGALMAQALTDIGLRPIIIDRRSSALLGSTAASTAMLQFELDTPLGDLRRSLGVRKANQVWIASRQAVNELRTRTHRLGIAAHLKTRPSLYLAGNLLDARGLANEVLLRQRIGLSSEMLNRQALRHHFNIDRQAAILTHGNAEANPLELAAGYLRAAIRAGARLNAPHEIVDIQRNRTSTTLFTHDGIEIQARSIIFCTGYELPKIVSSANTQIMASWAIATCPQPQRLWPQKALIWEASDPYLYIRSSVDGRVICGGEDQKVATTDQRNALTERKARRIQHKLSQMFPRIDSSAEFSWTGSFGISPNGMPTIGEIPGFPKCFSVMGFGGNGITFSMLASKLIVAAIQKKTCPEAKLFAFA